MLRDKILFVILVFGVVGAGGYAHSRPRGSVQPQGFRFHLEEATIADVHRAIQSGQITCRGLVQAYLNRARAYNGVCNRPVTEEMAPDYLPRYSEYKAAVAETAGLADSDRGKTLPIEFGRLEPTASDPSVE